MKKGELEAGNQLTKSRYMNLQHVWSIVSKNEQLEKLLDWSSLATDQMFYLVSFN